MLAADRIEPVHRPRQAMARTRLRRVDGELLGALVPAHPRWRRSPDHPGQRALSGNDPRRTGMQRRRANPIAIVVSCHQVVAADGDPTSPDVSRIETDQSALGRAPLPDQQLTTSRIYEGCVRTSV